MNKQNINTLIIPDVHGRLFWKSAVKQFPIDEYPDLTIIFLGDYLDPYTSFEYITKDMALDNFKEILSYAKTDNRVILLLGNHDLHYILNKCDLCRIDLNNFNEIEKLFKTNLNMFRISYNKIINDKQYLFTHAGLTNKWVNTLYNIYERNKNSKHISAEQLEWQKNNLTKDIVLNPDILNNFIFNNQGLHLLSMVGRERGGYDPCGSCLWADFEEFYYTDNIPKNNMYQIFAHSLAIPDLDNGIITDEFAMVDSRCAWVIYENNTLEKL